MPLTLERLHGWNWSITTPEGYHLVNGSLTNCLDHIDNIVGSVEIHIPEFDVTYPHSSDRHDLERRIYNLYNVLHKVKTVFHTDDISICNIYVWIFFNHQHYRHQYVGTKEYRAWLKSLRLLGVKFNHSFKEQINNESDEPNICVFKKIY